MIANTPVYIAPHFEHLWIGAWDAFCFCWIYMGKWTKSYLEQKERFLKGLSLWLTWSFLLPYSHQVQTIAAFLIFATKMEMFSWLQCGLMLPCYCLGMLKFAVSFSLHFDLPIVPSSADIRSQRQRSLFCAFQTSKIRTLRLWMLMALYIGSMAPMWH